MGDARADEATDHDGYRERIDPLVTHEVTRAADRHEGAEDHADEREERVPRDAE